MSNPIVNFPVENTPVIPQTPINPAPAPKPSVPTPVPPEDPPVPPEDPPCEPKPCVPTEVPITLEIAPVIKLCIDKPTVTLKNNAECICKPCNEQ